MMICVCDGRGKVLGVRVCINTSKDRAYPYDFNTCYLPVAPDLERIRKIIAKQPGRNFPESRRAVEVLSLRMQ